MPKVHRTDVIGLWRHPSDTTQTVLIRDDGTFLIRNVSLGVLNGDPPDRSAPYEQSGTWTLKRFYESPHRYYLQLLGVNSDGMGFVYTFPVLGAGSTAVLYLPLHGRQEGQRFEFTR